MQQTMTGVLRVAAAAALAALAALAGCDNGQDTRPADLALRFSWDFGIAGVKGALDLRNGASRYEERRGANTIRFAFKPAPAQLDRVWKTLQANNVETIRLVAVKPVAGGDSEKLAVTWGDKRVIVDRTTAKRLASEDQDRWRAIVSALRALIRAERRKRGLAAD